MNLVKQNHTIQLALTSPAAEFFKAAGEIYCLFNGKVHRYDQIPDFILKIVKKTMLADKQSITQMLEAEIAQEEEQLKHYIGELYGAFDSSPDISADGILQHHEFVYTHKKKLKQTIELKHGKLTQREIEVLTEAGLCKLDKEICETLCISNDTLRNHKDNISRKAGTERKSALAVLAYKLNLVELK